MQGFNMGRYVPPEDIDRGLSFNQSSGKGHALGARAKNISQGILTVRFEMPFPIWCTTCPKPTIIGQGVRFNAEKKKVGNYYTTPILSFRMKHTACGGSIEIRTDPENTAYVVHEGARKRDYGDEKFKSEQELEGGVKVLTTEEREKLRADAFSNLEHKVGDKARVQEARKRIEELQEVQDTAWEDPYLQNRKLRQAFRIGRHEREAAGKVTAALQDKMSLGIDLLPENEDDRRRAGLIDFGELETEPNETGIRRAITRPLFESADAKPNTATRIAVKSKKLKPAQVAEKRKADFAAEIRGNTRAKMDPFLVDRGAVKSSSSPRLVLGIKRKQDVGESGNLKGLDASATAPAIAVLPKEKEDEHGGKGLVDYDSD